MTYEMECTRHRKPHRFAVEIPVVEFTGEAPCDRCGKPCTQNWSRKALSIGCGPTVHARRYIPGDRGGT